MRRYAVLAHPADGLAAPTEAVKVLADSPARLEYGKAQARLGVALRNDGREHAARDALYAALDAAEVRTADVLANSIRVELRRAGGRPRRAAGLGIESLTPREARVAAQTARGRSNWEIAESLFVTVKTVETHLTNTFRKLGVTERTALARLFPPPRPGP